MARRLSLRETILAVAAVLFGVLLALCAYQSYEAEATQLASYNETPDPDPEPDPEPETQSEAPEPTGTVDNPNTDPDGRGWEVECGRFKKPSTGDCRVNE